MISTWCLNQCILLSVFVHDDEWRGMEQLAAASMCYIITGECKSFVCLFVVCGVGVLLFFVAGYFLLVFFVGFFVGFFFGGDGGIILNIDTYFY